MARAAIVGVLALTALAVRVGYIEHTPYRAINDSGTYNRLGSMIARHGDYATGRAPGSGAGNSRGPTAYFPPGYPYFLGAVDILTGHQNGHRAAVGPARLAQALTGTAAVGLIGLVALEALGPGAALAAMLLAAVYPVLVELSGTLVSENLLIVLELAATWTALRARRARRLYPWIAATGVLTGLATLTHENAILLVIPFAFAVTAAARPQPDRTRPRLRALAAPTTLILITGATIAPWTIRNAIELHHFVPVSDQTGITLVGTYNPDSAAFAAVPYKWRYFAKIAENAGLVRPARQLEEVALGDRLQAQALSYIGEHPLAPLAVGFHNTLRMFELEGAYAWQASARAVGLPVGVARTGVIAFWVLCLLALAGLLTPAARRAPRWLWAIPVLYALSIVFVNVETPRLRAPIDPFLILLAGGALYGGATRLGLRGSPVRRGRRAQGMAGHGQLVEMVQRLT